MSEDKNRKKVIEERAITEINSKVDFALGTVKTKPIDKNLMTGASSSNVSKGGKEK